MDKPDSPEDDVHCSGDGPPDPKSNGQSPDPEMDVHCFLPVPEGDLGEQGAKDIHADTTHACAHARDPLVLELPVDDDEAWDSDFGVGCSDPESRLG